MVVDIWRDMANNKVYVRYGLETIEVPHVIAEAYRQNEAKLLKELKEARVSTRTFERCYEHSKIENMKLRELVDKLLYGIEHDVTPADALVWGQEVDAMLRDLGIKEDE